MSKFLRAGRLFTVMIFLLIFVVPSYAFDVVNSNSEGIGSLAWAIDQANLAGGGTINVNPSVKSITLNAELAIRVNATINGEGVTLSGTGTHRLFKVTGGSVTFNRITFTKGNASSGNGGAVEVDSTNASAEFNNCTFYDNQARDYGGAVCVTNGSETSSSVMKHCTIAGNMAGNGGGVALLNGEMSLMSSVVLGNTGSSDIYASSSRYFRSHYNVTGSSSFVMDSTDLTGQALSSVLASANGQPKVESADNITLIRTSRTSPAIDFVPNITNYVLSYDVLGHSRPQLSMYDAGAYEAMPYPVTSAEIYGLPYLQINDTRTYSVDIKPESASLNVKDYPPYGIEWISSSTSVLSIDNTGRASATGKGSSYITARVHGWQSDGSPLTVSARAFIVYVDEVPFTEMKATIGTLEDKTIKINGHDEVKPDVRITVGAYELSNLRGEISYSLEASSSRADIVMAEVVSSDTIRLIAGERAGSSDVIVTARPSPVGQSMRTSFTVSVVSEDNQTIGKSGGGGGCNSVLAAGAMVLSVIFLATKGRKE